MKLWDTLYLVWTHTIYQKKQKQQKQENFEVDVDVVMKKAEKRGIVQMQGDLEFSTHSYIPQENIIM